MRSRGPDEKSRVIVPILDVRSNMALSSLDPDTIRFWTDPHQLQRHCNPHCDDGRSEQTGCILDYDCGDRLGTDILVLRTGSTINE